MEENKQVTTGSATLAVVSMVLGILSYASCMMIFFSVPAVICGHISLSHIKKGAASGKGFAVAGLVLGYINIALFIVFMMLIVAALFIGDFLSVLQAGLRPS